MSVLQSGHAFRHLIRMTPLHSRSTCLYVTTAGCASCSRLTAPGGRHISTRAPNSFTRSHLLVRQRRRLRLVQLVHSVQAADVAARQVQPASEAAPQLSSPAHRRRNLQAGASLLSGVATHTSCRIRAAASQPAGKAPPAHFARPRPPPVMLSGGVSDSQF